MLCTRSTAKGVMFELFYIEVPTFLLPEVEELLNRLLYKDGETFTITKDINEWYSGIQIVCERDRYVKVMTKLVKKRYITKYHEYL